MLGTNVAASVGNRCEVAELRPRLPVGCNSLALGTCDSGNGATCAQAHKFQHSFSRGRFIQQIRPAARKCISLPRPVLSEPRDMPLRENANDTNQLCKINSSSTQRQPSTPFSPPRQGERCKLCGKLVVLPDFGTKIQTFGLVKLRVLS